MNLELYVSLRSRILSTCDMVTESHVVSELFYHKIKLEV
jgi:hypothetical protein